MITYPYPVIREGGEWFGCTVSIDGDVITISEGRIGRAENPLTIEDGIVDGGWFYEGETLAVLDTDTRLDLFLDTENNEVFLNVRSDDPRETYDGDKYTLLIPLAQRYDDEWHVATPHYEGN